MTIAELIEQLGETKKLGNETYKTYKEIKQAEDDLKLELVAKLDDAGLKSAKGQKYQAVMTERTDIGITHEQSVLDWLRETPEIESDFYIGLKKTEFKTLAKAMLKETGEVIPGTELVRNESLMVRSNK